MGYSSRRFLLPSPVKIASLIAVLSVSACQAQGKFAQDKNAGQGAVASAQANKPEDYDGWTFELLDAKIRINPRDPSYYALRGHLHQRRDERDEAIADYDKAIQLAPAKGEYYLARSEMRMMMTDYNGALADADKATTLMPGSTMPFSQRARIEMVLQNYTAAIADIKRALKYDPHDLLAVSTLTQAYDQQGRLGEALGAANYGIEYGAKQCPDQIYFFYQDRALVLLHAGQYAAADKDLEAGIAADATHSQLWAYKALLYAMQDDMVKDEAALAKLMQLDTFAPRANRLKGETYRAAGQWQKAIDAYHVSTRLEPTYGPGFMQCGIAQLASGDLAGAAVNLREAIRLVPTSALSHSYLALTLSQMGNEAESKAQLEKAFALNGDLPGNFINRAQIRFLHGDLKGAMDDCRQALALDNYSADAHGVASLLLRTAKQDAAADSFAIRAKSLGYHPPTATVVPKSPVAATAGSTIDLPVAKPLQALPVALVDVDAAP